MLSGGRGPSGFPWLQKCDVIPVISPGLEESASHKCFPPPPCPGQAHRRSNATLGRSQCTEKWPEVGG